MKARRVLIPRTEEMITIEEITEEDAVILRKICRRIQGDPTGPRGAANRLEKALEAINVEMSCDAEYPAVCGSISFSP